MSRKQQEAVQQETVQQGVRQQIYQLRCVYEALYPTFSVSENQRFKLYKQENENALFLGETRNDKTGYIELRDGILAQRIIFGNPVVMQSKINDGDIGDDILWTDNDNIANEAEKEDLIAKLMFCLQFELAEVKPSQSEVGASASTATTTSVAEVASQSEVGASASTATTTSVAKVTFEKRAPTKEEKLEGMLLLQAILDALGVMTEFLDRNQAMELVPEYNKDQPILDYSLRFDRDKYAAINDIVYSAIRDENGRSILDSHNRIITFQNGTCVILRGGRYEKFEGATLKNATIELNGEVLKPENGKIIICQNSDIFVMTEKGKVMQLRKSWRESAPKGATTDDTDQAMLKFLALVEAYKLCKGKSHAEILEMAQKIYAEKILLWSEGEEIKYFNKSPFGLGGNTADVIRTEGFVKDPLKISKEVWLRTAMQEIPVEEWRKIGNKGKGVERVRPSGFFSAANGALMSSSYILQFYADDTDPGRAVEAAVAFAKVTHWDPSVSAHCAAYANMLFRMIHHEGDINDKTFQTFLIESLDAGKKVFRERLLEKDIPEEYKLTQKKLMAQMEKAVFSEGFEKWEDLQLTQPHSNLEGYDNIGMSHRALSAGFFALKQLRVGITGGKNVKQLVSEICTNMIREGGDADTNGTIVGSLIGAMYGVNNIPQKWIDGLRDHEKELIRQIGNTKELPSASVSNPRRPDIHDEKGCCTIS